ncbi:MAG: hypothetical protein WCQ47_02145 [bacterium]
MIKKNVKWLMVIILAFLAGFIFNSYTNDRRKPVNNDIKINGEIFKPIAYKNSDQKEMPDETKRAYHNLISAYFTYINNEDTDSKTTFSEFIKLRRDKKIQDKTYSIEDEKVEKQVLEWYGRLNDINKIPGYEVNTYHVNGTVTLENGLRNICSTEKRKVFNILVGVYLNPLTKNLFPVVPVGNINTEQPLDYSFVDCENRNFQLSFILGNQMEMESPPVYLVAYAFYTTSNGTPSMIAMGTENKVSGIPPSVLSKRKTNQPVVIKLSQLKKETTSSDINMDTSPNSLINTYGLDDLAAIIPDFKTFRTTISAANGLARIKSLPINSNILFEISKQDGQKTSFIVPTSSDDINIEIPNTKDLKNNSLIVIPPVNIKDGEIIIFSKTNKNKFSYSFNNQERKNITIDNLADTETFLEIRSENRSVGLMPVYINKKGTSIIEPSPKIIDNISGQVFLNDSVAEGKRPCKECLISVKYTDKYASTNNNGVFAIKNLAIIDNQAQFNIDTNGSSVIYNILTHGPIDKLNLNITIPSKNLLDSWNQIIPTMPNNGLVFVYYPQRSLRSFLVKIDDYTTIKANYFSEKANLPSKQLDISPYEPSSPGFGKFIFSDIKPGNYVLYLLNSDRIIHSRIIRVEAGKITLIN